MNGDELRRSALDYLRRHTTMTIATCAAQRPWAAALFYANRGFVFYFLSDPATDHCRQIAVNPVVALTIQDDHHDWREIKGLQVQGRAEPVASEGETEQAWRLYLAKYPFVQGLLAAKHPVGARLLGIGDAEMARRLGSVRFYRVTATRVLQVDNSWGFGHREEVPLE